MNLTTNSFEQLYHFLENFALDESREIFFYRLCFLMCHRLMKKHTFLKNIDDVVIVFESSYESKINIMQS